MSVGEAYLIADRARPLANGALMDVGEHASHSQTGTLRASFSEHLQFENGMAVAASGQPSSHAYLVADGFLFQVIQQSGKRSIVGVAVPGDIIGFSAIGRGRVEFDLVAAGRTVVARLGFRRFGEIVTNMPEIAVKALSNASAVQRQWIANCQRLDAAQHIAHIYAELRHRLARSLGGLKQVVRAPFSQTDLGDMCGISAIHANRAVATLRKRGLAEIRRGDLYTADWQALEQYANFDAEYLREV